MKEAPSPPGLPFIGHLLRRQLDGPKLYLEAAETLGPFVRFNFAGRTLFLVSDPGGIQRVLVENARNYTKGFGYAAMKRVMGEGLVTAEGAPWLEQRRRSQPSFHPQRLQALQTALDDEVARGVATWSPGVVDVFKPALALSRRVAARTLFGTDAELDSLDEVIPLLQREVTRETLSLWPWRRTDRAFEGALKTLDDFIEQLVRTRRAGSPRGDLLDDLIAAWPDEPRQLRDALVTLFLAAYETTATSLTWTLRLLAEHPHALERVAAGEPDFTKQVVEESLRLYPAIWLFARKAVEDDVVADYRVPAGAYVLVSPWVNHRLSRFWSEPLAFRPERFSPEEKARHPKHAFIPFAVGPRQCIGAGFAMMELVSMVTHVARRFRLSLIDAKPPRLEPLITLQPKDGLRLKLTPREGAA